MAKFHPHSQYFTLSKTIYVTFLWNKVIVLLTLEHGRFSELEAAIVSKSYTFERFIKFLDPN